MTTGSSFSQSTEELLSREDRLLVMLRQQLEKDLQISLPKSPSEIISIVLSHTQKHNSDAEYLRQMLYRIDVSEVQLAQIIQNSGWTEAECITWCILEREWQKVQWRDRFS